MKIIIIIANILTVLGVSFAWLMTALVGFGSPTGTSGASSHAWITTWLIVLFGVVSIICSHVDHNLKRALVWAIAPIILFLIQIGYSQVKSARRDVFIQQEQINRLNNISHDFVCMNPSPAIKETFLTIDKETNLLVKVSSPIDFKNTMIYPQVLGKLDGNTLQSEYSDKETLNSLLETCVNSEGKSVFDVYTVEYSKNIEYSNEDIEKFKYPYISL
jgi:hypothetical protein